MLDGVSIYALMGDESSQELISRIEGLPYIDRIDRVQVPYKLMNKESSLAQHQITVGKRVLPGDFAVIAGHCTIDPNNKNFFLESSHAVKEAGADMIRAASGSRARRPTPSRVTRRAWTSCSKRARKPVCRLIPK